MEVGRLQVSLAGSGHEIAFCTESEAWPGRPSPVARQGVKGTVQRGTETAAEDTGHKPEGSSPVQPYGEVFRA